MVCQFGAGKNEFVTGGERQVNDKNIGVKMPIKFLTFVSLPFTQ